MTKARRSLKDQNRIPIISVALGNAIALYLLSQAHQFQIVGFLTSLQSGVGLVPAGIAFAITSIITELFDSTTKARLVFWRWADPLPGSRAFSELAERDARVNLRRLRKEVGAFPEAPHDQNALWYSLYLRYQNDDRVLHTHRGYLFARDCSVVAVLFLAVGGVIGAWIIPDHRVAATYVACLAIQYLMVRLAAKHLGERLVTTVLALCSNA